MNDEKEMLDLIRILEEDNGRYEFDPQHKDLIEKAFKFFSNYCSNYGGIMIPPEIESDLGRVSMGANFSEFEVSGDDLDAFAEMLDLVHHFWINYYGKKDSISFGDMEFRVSIDGVCIDTRGEENHVVN